MSEESDTEEMRADQLAREMREQEQARSASAEDEAAQHERRADKAKYLRGKLEERAESEREAARNEEDG